MDDLKSRFWARVQRLDDGECWPWLGYIDRGGYGRITVNRAARLAHRISWLVNKGEMPPSDLCVCHSCDVRHCVNPGHLWLGTYYDNNHDKIAKGRAADIFGEANPRSILTAEQVLEILNDDRKQIDIAAAYGVKRSAVCNIKLGHSWRRIYSEWISLDATRRAEMKL